MKRLIGACLVSILVAGVAPVAMAGGGGKKQQTPSDMTPAQKAIEAYNAGISARDAAWEIEEQFAGADAAQRDKLGARLEKTYRAAVKSFKKATSHNAKMYEAHSELGYCLRKLGDYEASLAAYDQALELEPGYARAIEYRAEAYLGLGRVAEAKAAYMTLFEGQSDQAPALLEAMRKWVAENPDAKEFSAWVAERAEIAGQAKSVSQLKDADW